MRKTKTYWFIYLLQLAILIIAVGNLSGCGKVKVDAKPIKVEHTLTIDIEAFKELCQYSATPETCIQDFIDLYNTQQGSI